MEQRHVVYIAAAAVTAGTLAACHLMYNHHNLPLFSRNSKGSSNITRYARIGSKSSSSHVRAPFMGTSAKQAVSVYQWDWAQSFEELLVEMHLPRNVAQQDAQVKLQQQHLTVWVGQQCIINGTLAGQIQPQHSSWRLEGQGSHRVLSISLCKAPPQGTDERFAIWTSLLLAEDDTATTADQVSQQQ